MLYVIAPSERKVVPHLVQTCTGSLEKLHRQEDEIKESHVRV